MTSLYTQLHRNPTSTDDVTIRTILNDVTITVSSKHFTSNTMKKHSCPTCGRILPIKTCKERITFKCRNIEHCHHTFPALTLMVQHSLTCYVILTPEPMPQEDTTTPPPTTPAPDAGSPQHTLPTPTDTSQVDTAPTLTPVTTSPAPEASVSLIRHTATELLAAPEPPQAPADNEEDQALLSFLHSIATEGNTGTLPDIDLLYSDDDHTETTPTWSPLTTDGYSLR